MSKYIHDDGEAPCPECGKEPEIRKCDFCEATGRIIDCAHMSQPRPIAVTENGKETICDKCYEKMLDRMALKPWFEIPSET